MNPNLPLYGLGAGPNVNMLDNMLMAAGFQATEACEQLEAPLLFLGPHEYEGAVIGGRILHASTKSQSLTDSDKRKEIVLTRLRLLEP